MFTESLHPRGPKGSANGGQFAASGQGSSSSAASHKAHPPATAHAHASVKLTKTLSYDPHSKRGPGYGVKGGDPHVRQLQDALNRLGATDSNGRRLGVDGDLGPLTTSAIERAQKALGLKVDGKVGPALFEMLLRAKSLPGIKVHHAAPHQAHQAPHHGPGAHRVPAHNTPADQTPRPNKPKPSRPASSARQTHASARSMDGAAMDMSGGDPEQQLMDLLSGLSDDELNELAALAEAMHADGGN